MVLDFKLVFRGAKQKSERSLTPLVRNLHDCLALDLTTPAPTTARTTSSSCSSTTLSGSWLRRSKVGIAFSLLLRERGKVRVACSVLLRLSLGAAVVVSKTRGLDAKGKETYEDLVRFTGRGVASTSDSWSVDSSTTSAPSDSPPLTTSA